MRAIAPMCRAGFPDSLREPSNRFDAREVETSESGSSLPLCNVRFHGEFGGIGRLVALTWSFVEIDPSATSTRIFAVTHNSRWTRSLC